MINKGSILYLNSKGIFSKIVDNSRNRCGCCGKFTKFSDVFSKCCNAEIIYCEKHSHFIGYMTQDILKDDFGWIVLDFQKEFINKMMVPSSFIYGHTSV